MLAILYSNLLYFWKKKIFLTFFLILLIGFIILYFLSLLTMVDGRKVIVNGSFILLDVIVFLILLIYGSKFFYKEDKNGVSDFLWSKKIKTGYIYNGNLIGLYIVILSMHIMFFIFLIFFQNYLNIPISFGDFGILVTIQLIKNTLILSVFSFFATFISRSLVIFLMICFYFIIHSLDFLYRYTKIQTETNIIIENIISIMYYILPSFNSISIDNILSNGYNTNTTYGITILLIYIIVTIIGGNVIYSKKRKYGLLK